MAMNRNDCARRRREMLGRCRRVVVKAGTRLLTDRDRIAELVDGIAALRQRKLQTLLVTSGAVGMGMRVLELKKRPRDLAAVQALAAIGQSKLMSIYEEECRARGFATAQLLLTAADLRARSRYLNVMNCISSLWEKNVLPIVNENDSVSVDELKFGDNDILAGMLAALTGAELGIILTTEAGLRERVDGRLRERISVVEKIDGRIRDMAAGTDNADFSIGGMSSKIRAAELVTGAGAHLWIADGRTPGILPQILAGEDVGTLFLPGKNRVPGHKRWLRFFAGAAGTVSVDAGAAEALRRRGGSLLPSGVTAVAGDFTGGDTVDILDPAGALIARGLVNYSRAECETIKGRKSAELAAILGHAAYSEIVHRDNLTLV